MSKSTPSFAVSDSHSVPNVQSGEGNHLSSKMSKTLGICVNNIEHHVHNRRVEMAARMMTCKHKHRVEVKCHQKCLKQLFPTKLESLVT